MNGLDRTFTSRVTIFLSPFSHVCILSKGHITPSTPVFTKSMNSVCKRLSSESLIGYITLLSSMSKNWWIIYDP